MEPAVIRFIRGFFLGVLIAIVFFSVTGTVAAAMNVIAGAFR